MSLRFNHAGDLLASASFDGLIRLWNPDDGHQVASHPGGSWQLEFSADDRYLLGWQNLPTTACWKWRTVANAARFTPSAPAKSLRARL